MTLQDSFLKELEQAQLASVQRRIRNWVRCETERPPKYRCATYLAIQALRRAFLEPGTYPRCLQGYESDAYFEPLDYDDADFLTRVWAGMAHPEERDLLIGDTNVTIHTAKMAIWVYAFGSRNDIRGFYASLGMARRVEMKVERIALLFFYDRLKTAKNTVR